MSFIPAVPLSSKSLFTDGNLALFVIAVVFRLMVIGVSTRLLARNTRVFGRFSPAELQQPFKHLPKQQQYRYICTICLFTTLVVHLVYIVLDMVVASPDTPLSYKFGKINIVIIISYALNLLFLCSLCYTFLSLILTEVDRYKRITLVVPGSLRAKFIYGAVQLVKVSTVLVLLAFSATAFIYIRDETTQSNTFSMATMRMILTTRNGLLGGITVFYTLLEFYLNLSTVKCVLYNNKPKTTAETNHTASYRTRIFGFLTGVLVANFMSMALMTLGVFSGPFYPLVLLGTSSSAVSVSTSFSLTDTLLNCLHESKQENDIVNRKVDITGYRKGTDVYEEGLVFSDNKGPAYTQHDSLSER